MKLANLYTTVFALLFVFTVHAQAKRYPSFEEVVDKFYQSYDANAYNEMELDFAKAKEGWYVVTTDRSPAQISTLYLAWSANTGKWLDIGFTRNPSYPEKSIGWNAAVSKKHYLYDVSPYYGYDGWYNDAIKLLEPQKELSDSLLYGLAKAYYEKANALINDQYGFAIKGEQKRRKLPPNSLDDQTVSEYITYANKAIETFKRLDAQNPVFETFIGYMNLQISNEYMSNWLNLYTWQNEETANQFLIDGLYDQLMLDMTHNLLISCPPDAILFTNGDSDTYPLLYAQKKLKIRPDVTIVNLSLLNMAEYAIMLSENYKLFNKSISNQQLRSTITDQIVIGEKKNKQNTKKLADELEKFYAGESLIGMFPSSMFEIEGKGGKLQFACERPYILRGELMEWDIVTQNLLLRPICYAHTAEVMDLYKFSFANGSVNVIHPNGTENNGASEESFYNEKEHVDLLLHKFNYHEYSPEKYKSDIGKRFMYNAKFLYARTIATLIENKKKDDAILLLEKLEKVIPPLKSGFMYPDILIAEAYGDLGEKEKALWYCNQLKESFSKLKEGDSDFRYKKVLLESVEEVRIKINR